MAHLDNPTHYASGYTLDLYCDRSGLDAVPTQDSPDGIHKWNEFPHTFLGETFGECAREARRHGWVIHTKTRTATCPTCSGKRK
jgi:hypothetical protein